jgi:hypothetical protein
MSIELTQATYTPIKINPGDTIVVSCKHALTVEQMDYLNKTLKDKFPDNMVLVIDSSTNIDVYRSE